MFHLDYSAYRRSCGSYFIQTLCKVFKENAHNTHLNDMMLMVNRDLREKKFTVESGETVAPVSDTSMNTFNRRLYFYPKNTFNEYKKEENPLESKFK